MAAFLPGLRGQGEVDGDGLAEKRRKVEFQTSDNFRKYSWPFWCFQKPYL
jgi:hypothetical protein